MGSQLTIELFHTADYRAKCSCRQRL